MPQFDVSLFSSQIFWLALVFGSLYLLVSFFIAPKAESILSSRDKHLGSNVRSAEMYSQKVSEAEKYRASNLSDIDDSINDMYRQVDVSLESYYKSCSQVLSDVVAKEKKASIDQLDSYVKHFHANKVESSINLSAFIIEKFTSTPADIKLLREIYKKIS